MIFGSITSAAAIGCNVSCRIRTVLGMPATMTTHHVRVGEAAHTISDFVTSARDNASKSAAAFIVAITGDRQGVIGTWDNGYVRSTASILHLDLDAFFAAVEQRDKPSLRGKPVCVGGIGHRGVVATASYEARAFGARSAMPTVEALRRCPLNTAFLYPRGSAYRKSSKIVMDLLHQVSPVVEQVSMDEAYVDLLAGVATDLSAPVVRKLVIDIIAEIAFATGRLGASAGVASSKMLAKIASELDKPNGLVVIPPGRELESLAPLSVRVISGIGPATATRLRTFAVETVADLQRMPRTDLMSIFGGAHGGNLYELARAWDDREVVVERETKSMSAERTFQTDIVDRFVLDSELTALVRRTTARLGQSAVFARTVTIKVRYHDFATLTRSETLLHPTGHVEVILDVARRLLAAVDTSNGLRLLGVGVSGLMPHVQEYLIFDNDDNDSITKRLLDSGDEEVSATPVEGVRRMPGLAASTVGDPPQWCPGQDVKHAEYGPGWVWGSGLSKVTVRFEGPRTPPGCVRTFRVDNPAVCVADPPQW